MDGRRGAKEFERLVVAALPSIVSEVVAQGAVPLYRSVLARVEGPLLRHALEISGGNQLKAARLLGINRNTLRKRLRLLGLLPPAPRNGKGSH
ncbi:MAG: helix-turn-helix domain-containing protein [Candidatus Rokuibacteriota bacterium]